MDLRLLILAGVLATGPAPISPTATDLIVPDVAGMETIELAEGLQVVPLDEGVYQVIHAFPWRANSLLVRVSDDTMVWVDTPYEDKATERVVEWLHNTFGEVRIIEINTGYHWDNAGGNGFLLEQGIPVYGADLSARLLQERGEWIRTETLAMLEAPEHASYRALHAGQVFHSPDHTFPAKEGLRLQFGDEVVEVFFPGPSHAPDNLVVYFRERRLLFGGCMIRALGARETGYTGDADLAEWPGAVRRTLERYPAVQMVIPGHGAAGGPELLDHTIRILER